VQRQELLRLQESWHTRQRPENMPACQAESTAFCPDATPGPPHLECLYEHLAELSEACRTALQGRRGEDR